MKYLNDQILAKYSVLQLLMWNIIVTRMHSSRMRTARSSSRLLGGGVCLSACSDTPPGLGLDIPLGVGLEAFHGQTPNLPRVWAQTLPVNRILDTRF